MYIRMYIQCALLGLKIMFNLIAGNQLLAVKSMCKEAGHYTTFPLLGLDCNFKE